ncbi:MAG: helix-hairpin-helix domain-containing protein [Fimbriimonas sp.]|nr:helix-hairpin-helix domain-containing protein [Fimbriimonas sp.]
MSDPDEKTALKLLATMPNVGPSIARDLYMLGYRSPESLKGADAEAMYSRLCEMTGARQDPCVLDTFMSVVSFAEGNLAQPWWHFTPERKRRAAQKAEG